jgi:hypothetical protein
MGRFLSALILTFLGGFLLFWSWIHYPDTRNWVLDRFHIGDFQTLEARYSPKWIMEKHKKELLKDRFHTFLEPSVQFHPYLLMEVKYTRSPQKTCEGVILWSLVDGEMVLNTSSWEKTHGFVDCLLANADREDFKVLNALCAHGDVADRESLGKHLSVEDEILDLWLDKCRLKNLIVQHGSRYRLHLENPKLYVYPETAIDEWFVTKPAHKKCRLPRKFRSAQIESIAKAAFGTDFAIRKTTEIFLPVIQIKVQNPDGSQMTSYWNALNGKRFSQTYQIE